MGGCIGYMYTGTRQLLLSRPFISSFFFLTNYQTLKFFITFSQKLWGLEDWNLVHRWIVGRCIVFTGIRLLLLICRFISSVFFLSNFQTLKCFVTLFSRIVRPRLKLGTHVDSGQMYRVYRNQTATAYSSLYFFIFFLSNFQTLKVFITLLSGTVRPRSKLGTHVDSGCVSYIIVYTRIRLLLLICPFIFFFLQYSNIKNFRHSFLRNCEA